MLKLYRLIARGWDYGDVHELIIWAESPGDAFAVLESSADDILPGFNGALSFPYTVTEVEPTRGVVLSYGQDG